MRASNGAGTALGRTSWASFPTIALVNKERLKGEKEDEKGRQRETCIVQQVEDGIRSRVD